jgi:hypothetical protein
VIELLPLTLVCLYFVPFMVAAARDHDSYIAVLVVNAVVGWTVIGWIACLIWASFTPARALSPTPATSLRRAR